MKSIILKSVVLVSLALPMVSYAVNSGECGAGIISAIRHNVNSGTESFDHVVMNWASDHVPSQQWYRGVIIRNPTLSNTARVAFLNGSPVRFLSSNNQCPNVDQIIQCLDMASCYNFQAVGVY